MEEIVSYGGKIVTVVLENLPGYGIAIHNSVGGDFLTNFIWQFLLCFLLTQLLSKELSPKHLASVDDNAPMPKVDWDSLNAEEHDALLATLKLQEEVSSR